MITVNDERLATSLGYALVRAFRQVNRFPGRALQPFGLSAEQAHILMVLWLEGSMKVGHLQRLLMLSSATLTGALDRMEKQKLCRRVDDPEDRRAYRVEPVPMDARTRRRIEAALEEVERDAFAALSAKERAELLRLLDKVSSSLPS